MLKSFKEVMLKLKKIPSKKVVIPGADFSSSVKAACMAKKMNIADFLLIGDEKKIVELIKKENKTLINKFDIIHSKKKEESVQKAVRIIKHKEAGLLLKGHVSTAQLMKAVFDKENGLKVETILGDVFVFENNNKLTLMSDGGIVLNPDIEKKIALLKNAVNVAKKLEAKLPKVAILAAVEKVNSKMQATLDAASITEMNKRGEIKECLVDGPFALDIAVSSEAARIKKIDSPVAGNADILIMPNIEAGNIFGKSINYYAHLNVGHVIIGAEVPILITSRADDAQTKLNSIALGMICA
ncbi:MAG: hypothetical protein KGY75_00460 [Candidatus Cloacimonetes bacterium]|nr:hypothetical protein [Candidatus Cloacimonadota bacterium]